MKRLLIFICVFVLAFGFGGCSAKNVTILDSESSVIAAVSKKDYASNQLEADGYDSYVKLVLDEAEEILSEIYSCTAKEAEKKLFKEGFTVKTAFDKTAYSAIENMYSQYSESGLAFGCAITDIDGTVRAVFSGGDDVYAIQPHAPFSTIKPLSVYAQAIEKGIIDRSASITDKPFKKIKDENGREKDWPTNPSGGYTYKNTTLQDCIKFSLNTTAVHCLSKLGVKESIDFLQSNFGMNLAYEQNKTALEGTDETIGNIALGYFNTGVTTVELAGYYQVFSRLGKYTKSHAVSEICDKNGNVVYSYSEEEKQVFSEETAYIMNRLLNSVVKSGGTGSAAKIESAQLVGKTGTGTVEGNWFVGVTPEYCCSVWHGDNDNNNVAAKMFSEVFASMPEHTEKEFTRSAKVHKVICCIDSGMQVTSNCKNIGIGYFAVNKIPTKCDMH